MPQETSLAPTREDRLRHAAASLRLRFGKEAEEEAARYAAFCSAAGNVTGKDLWEQVMAQLPSLTTRSGSPGDGGGTAFGFCYRQFSPPPNVTGQSTRTALASARSGPVDPQ